MPTLSKKTKLETIQTLRALSILSVLVYHTSYWASKGDLGVHIFFVISGYLMALILTKSGISIESVKDFYLRRIKRIVPLYLITLLLIQISSHFLLSKEKYRRATQDTIMALFFARNIHFEWDNISPSIHLWTVSTEMQYYLLVPGIFYFLLPMSYLKKVISLLIIGSASVFLYMKLPLVTGIYFMPGRLFEFLLGSLTFFTEGQILTFLSKARESKINDFNGEIDIRVEKKVSSPENFIGTSTKSKRNLLSIELIFSGISLLLFFTSCNFCFVLSGTADKLDVYITLLCAAGTILLANIDFFYAISMTIIISVILHHALEEFFIKTTDKIVFILIGILYFLTLAFILAVQLLDSEALPLDFKYGHFVFDE